MSGLQSLAAVRKALQGFTDLTLVEISVRLGELMFTFVDGVSSKYLKLITAHEVKFTYVANGVVSLDLSVPTNLLDDLILHSVEVSFNEVQVRCNRGTLTVTSRGPTELAEIVFGDDSGSKAYIV